MKRVKLEAVKTIMGKKFRVPKLDEDSDEPQTVETTDLVKILEVVIFGIPRQKLTMQDSIHGARLYEQLKGATDGVVAIEDAEHDWIKKKVEEFAPQFFGVNAVQIKDALENFERIHEKKGKAEEEKE